MSAPPPFETLLERHGATVLRVCRALVGGQDADDVWQETFLAALRAYPAGTAGGAPVRNWEAWLVTLARNQCLDHLRRVRRLPLVLAAPLSDTAAPGGDDVVGQQVTDQADAARVWATLALLPPKQRDAVIFRHVAGLPYAEVALLLGNAEAAARRAAADGLRTLRRHLGTERSEDWS